MPSILEDSFAGALARDRRVAGLAPGAPLGVAIGTTNLLWQTGGARGES